METDDGTMTLHDPSRRVTYRSRQGAASEARWVFLDGSGVRARPGAWRVLEFGFGAATTFTQLTRAHILRRGQDPSAQLVFHSVERDPIDPTLLDAIGLPEAPGARVARDLLVQANDGAPGPVHVHDAAHGIDATLHIGEFAALGDHPPLGAHAIFFDPFGPRTDVDSWTDDVFRVAAMHLASDGVLATYSAATLVKRGLAAAGLHVATILGHGRKREHVIASPSPEALAHGKLAKNLPPGATGR